MRTTDLAAREAIRAALRLGPRGNRQLEAAAGVSPATTKRILDELHPDIVSGGQTRRRKHALRRQVRGTLSTLEVFVINASGRARRSTDIELIQPGGCHAPMDPAVWPQEPTQDGWWEGLPYPMFDMRPQGYLGRIVAQNVARNLEVPANPEDWSDEDIIWFLAHFGADVPGDLIVGDRAMQLWTRQRSEFAAIPERSVRRTYIQRAQASVDMAGAGPSAGGEFPKFTAARTLAGASTPHVIVKFSGADESGPARRWADLLVCEHLALQAIGTVDGHCAARTRLIQAGGRTFLESERFDRHAEFGRSAVVTLSAVEAALIGAGPRAWPAVLKSPAAAHFFSPDVIDKVEELWWFGRFIANTDMHHGNLSLRPNGSNFQLAPAYDMLPMRYAPLRGGDVPKADFPVDDLPSPPRQRHERWAKLMHAAITFWDQASRDKRITPEFRGTCKANGEALRRWSDTWSE